MLLGSYVARVEDEGRKADQQAESAASRCCFAVRASGWRATRNFACVKSRTLWFTERCLELQHKGHGRTELGFTVAALGSALMARGNNLMSSALQHQTAYLSSNKRSLCVAPSTKSVINLGCPAKQSALLLDGSHVLATRSVLSSKFTYRNLLCNSLLFGTAIHLRNASGRLPAFRLSLFQNLAITRFLLVDDRITRTAISYCRSYRPQLFRLRINSIGARAILWAHHGAYSIPLDLVW